MSARTTLAAYEERINAQNFELLLDLIAPDGSSYRLKDTNNDSGDNINATYTVDASSEAANGTWKLRVYDRYNGDTGYINEWSLTF